MSFRTKSLLLQLVLKYVHKRTRDTGRRQPERMLLYNVTVTDDRTVHQERMGMNGDGGKMEKTHRQRIRGRAGQTDVPTKRSGSMFQTSHKRKRKQKTFFEGPKREGIPVFTAHTYVRIHPGHVSSIEYREFHGMSIEKTSR